MTLTLSDRPSQATPETVCPYKGMAGSWTLNVNGERIGTGSYPEPLDESLEARDHIIFSGEGNAVEVDGEQVE